MPINPTFSQVVGRRDVAHALMRAASAPVPTPVRDSVSPPRKRVEKSLRTPDVPPLFWAAEEDKLAHHRRAAETGKLKHARQRRTSAPSVGHALACPSAPGLNSDSKASGVRSLDTAGTSAERHLRLPKAHSLDRLWGRRYRLSAASPGGTPKNGHALASPRPIRAPRFRVLQHGLSRPRLLIGRAARR
jgi:hypothetical protein